MPEDWVLAEATRVDDIIEGVVISSPRVRLTTPRYHPHRMTLCTQAFNGRLDYESNSYSLEGPIGLRLLVSLLIERGPTTAVCDARLGRIWNLEADELTEIDSLPDVPSDQLISLLIQKHSARHRISPKDVCTCTDHRSCDVCYSGICL